MKYKIGRYVYKEISEEKWCNIFDNSEEEEKRLLVTLIDSDGDPIKYLIRIKKIGISQR